MQNKSYRNMLEPVLYEIANPIIVNLLYLIGVPTPVRVGMLEALWIELNLKNVVHQMC